MTRKGSQLVRDLNESRSRPYHPQTNGVVERFNKTIQEILFKTSLQNHVPWNLIVPKAAMAYRMGFQQSIGCAPYEMMFGRPPALERKPPQSPLCLHATDILGDFKCDESGLQNDTLDETECPHPPVIGVTLCERSETLKRKREICLMQDKIARRHQQNQYKRIHRVKEFFVPEWVFVRNKEKAKQKLHVDGPYRVLACALDQTQILVQIPVSL